MHTRHPPHPPSWHPRKSASMLVLSNLLRPHVEPCLIFLSFARRLQSSAMSAASDSNRHVIAWRLQMSESSASPNKRKSDCVRELYYHGFHSTIHNSANRVLIIKISKFVDSLFVLIKPQSSQVVWTSARLSIRICTMVHKR